jgi:predicted kinase
VDVQIGPRPIVVCGLPGSGKTTHARQVEQKLRAVRFCPDDWMNALEIGLWESRFRERIERLQWKLAQDLLALGHIVIIEWGTFLGLPLNFIFSTLLLKSSSIE